MKRSFTGEPLRGESVVGAFPPRQRREVYADWPALRRERECCDRRVRDLHSHAGQELRRLALVHREISRSHLENRTFGTHASERARRPASPRERHLHPVRHVGGQHLDRVDAMRVVEHVDVVEDEDRRSRHRVEHFPQPVNRRGDHRHPDRRRDVEDRRVDRSHVVEGSGDRGQQDGRVVVSVIERQPSERPSILRGPLRKECGLPVPRGSHDRYQRDAARCLELGNQVRPRDESLAANGRSVELRVREPGAARGEQGRVGETDGRCGMPLSSPRRVTDVDASLAPPRIPQGRLLRSIVSVQVVWCGPDRLLESCQHSGAIHRRGASPRRPQPLLDEHGLGSIVRPVACGSPGSSGKCCMRPHRPQTNAEMNKRRQRRAADGG